MHLVEIFPDENFIIDLRYATSRNFIGKPIYESSRMFLLNEAATKFQKAVQIANFLGLKIKVFDAYRSEEDHLKLWNEYPDDKYIANPSFGSNHSRGIAVDVTLTDSNGQELNMGTDFDNFSIIAHQGHMNFKEHEVKQILENRTTLLGIMAYAGFEMNPFEWWHYQLPVPMKYKIIKRNNILKKLD